MGIKDYLPKLPKRTIQNIGEYHAILFDCNFILHSKISSCKDFDDLYKKTKDHFKQILRNASNLNTIHIIFDGGKDENIQHNPKEETCAIRAKQENKNGFAEQLNTNYPEILAKFETAVIEIIETIKTMSMQEYEIVTNLSNKTGEGDWKIDMAIRGFPTTYTNICIVTKDSDLVQIAYINELKRTKASNIQNHIDVLTDISVNSLNIIPSVDVKQQFGCDNMDYILIIALMGNDYLPRIGIVTYPILQSAYNRYKNAGLHNIVTSKGIHLRNFHLFVACILLEKNVKYNSKNIEYRRFEVYFNNLQWFLKFYGVLENELEFAKYEKSTHYSSVMNLHNLFL
jgi:hypothetical protein